MFFLERYFLRHFGSSMTEYLYGLKRVPLSDRKRPDVNVALFCLVVVPYVHRKCEEFFVDEEVFLRSYSSSQTSSREMKWRIFRLKAYRFVRTSSISACALFKLLYSINRTEYFSPLLAYAETTLRRVSLADIRERQRVVEKRSTGGSFSHRLFQRLIKTLQTSLMFSAVMFKFLEWYYAPSNASRRDRALRSSQDRFPTNDVPPPPSLPSSTITPLRCGVREGSCPLCGRIRRNPAASSSGVVYCYACIVPYVRENGVDPSTGMRCDVNEIRRLI